MSKTMEKPKDMLCGPACIFYLSKMFQIDVKIPNDFIWITDIASFIETNLGHTVTLSCHNSTLWNDYCKIGQQSDFPFEGFQKLHDYLQNPSHHIFEQELSPQKITELLREGKVLLLNVSSAIFHNDAILSGGHYILVIEASKEGYLVVNPGSELIHVSYYSKEKIVSSCTQFGSWMLMI